MSAREIVGLLLLSGRRFVRLIGASVWPPEGSYARRSLRRAAILALFLPLFGLVQLLHWLGFLLDEVLFPGYRRVEVRRPLFVLGIPRSGTTHLHRVLAMDRRFTTFSAWECWIALSVTARRAVLLAARCDRALGAPVARLVRWVERRAFASIDGIHPVRLSSPEEDYFALTPILACFVLVVPFPSAEWLWRMASFDRDVPERERRLVMRYYESCLQRHLYVHGPDKTLLSKNAAFASLAGSLLSTFPDSNVVCCLRDPRETVPSQLSALDPGMQAFANRRSGTVLRDRMLEVLEHYYEHLHEVLDPDERAVFVTMEELSRHLAPTVTSIYRRFGLTLEPEVAARLAAADARSRSYRSRHRYDLEQYGLGPQEIRRRFAAAYRRFSFAPRPEEARAEAAAMEREVLAG